MANEMMQCGNRGLALSRPQVMGILNVTPDSFSDGGQLLKNGGLDRQNLLQRAAEMVAAGASLLDIGGESTRPGAQQVSIQQELDRVIPAVELISSELDVVISVDTSSAEVITAAAKAGCGMINDVRALTREGALKAAAATKLPVCLMHMQGQPKTMQAAPEYVDVVKDVSSFLQERVRHCQSAGIDRAQLLLDPGFGFGKTLEHNLQLLNRLPQLAELGLPLLVGTSRKSMIGQVLTKPVEERLFGSLATAVLAIAKGAWIIRVHDVAATHDAVAMTSAVLNESVHS
ncbi:dihydropteroate synthase [Motiliproteus sp. MSK22-1]|uniref:dihydropteroate synthase n=1 Tax=Motiliproteus sp. MSK22-1 TaxID=1897630 RepID=UPI000978A7A9|nr:dihydropteroate synthase [Motiliproteus sp. MSK22-1]OMH39073.1 dihydropteroate synthase [Motiliproteus sp. MSK22-1]